MNIKLHSIGTILLVYLSFISCAQQTTKEELDFDKVNKLSANHKNVPYTHIFLNIPAEYNFGEYQSTIFKNDYTGINVIDLAGSNFYSNTKEVTKLNLEKQGFKVHEFKEFKLNKNPAILYLATSPDGFNESYQLVTGDSTFSILLMGYTHPDDSKSLREIKEMILSLVYDKDHNIDFNKLAPFVYDESKTRFKLADATSTFYTYSIDGIKKNRYDFEPIISVMTIPNQGYSPKSVSLKLANDLRAQGIELNLKEDSFEKINGYKSYEVVYNGIQKGEDLIMYYAIIIKDDLIIAVQGRSNVEFDDSIREMKIFTRAVKFK